MPVGQPLELSIASMFLIANTLNSSCISCIYPILILSCSMKWPDLNIKLEILSTITDKFQFSSLTPVQEHTIPLFLTCKDVAVEAVTGSGHLTFSFFTFILKSLHFSAVNLFRPCF